MEKFNVSSVGSVVSGGAASDRVKVFDRLSFRDPSPLSLSKTAYVSSRVRF